MIIFSDFLQTLKPEKNKNFEFNLTKSLMSKENKGAKNWF